MKKTIIVLMMVLLAAVLMVSCNNNANTPDETVYQVGDEGPAGGIIFYVNPNASTDGWTYLEAAKSDFKTEIQWAPDTVTAVDIKTKTGIGEGKENTKKISELDDAEQYSAVYSFYGTNVYKNGFKDWFLPSRDELDLLLKNTDLADSITKDVFYWSSSECYGTDGEATNKAYAVKAETNGNLTSSENCTSLYHVRLIRMF